MSLPERSRDLAVGRRVVNGRLTAEKVRFTEKGRSHFDEIVLSLMPRLVPLARQALARRSGGTFLPSEADVEGVAERAAAKGIGRMAHCSVFYFTNAIGRRWIQEVLNREFRLTEPDRRAGSDDEPGPRPTDLMESPGIDPPLERFFDRAAALRLLLRLSRRVWTYAGLAEAIVCGTGWKGRLAGSYLAAGNQGTLSADFGMWGLVAEQLDRAIERTLQDVASPVARASVPGFLHDLIERPSLPNPRVPLEVETVLAALAEWGDWSESESYEALGVALRRASGFVRAMPRDSMALAVIELGAVAGEYGVRDECVDCLARQGPGPAESPGRPRVGGALESVLNALPPDHTERDPRVVLTGIEALAATVRRPVGRVARGKSSHVPVDQDRIPIEDRSNVLVALLEPSSPLFNVWMYLGLGGAQRDLPARLPSLHNGPPELETDTKARCLAIVEGWSADAVRRPIFDRDDEEARLRLVGLLELPPFLARPTREGREVLETAVDLLREWIDDPSRAPGSWADLVDSVRVTILSALAVALTEDLHEDVKLIYEGRRGFTAAPSAPEFLQAVLGPTPREGATWPSPQRVRQNLLALNRAVGPIASEPENAPATLASN
ncbi:MAG: hypothetical protein AB7I30_14050 [Isosphaeraceae bacterium]